jgi:basic membrane protein A
MTFFKSVKNCGVGRILQKTKETHMKKTLALLLVAVMAFAMVACNAQSNEKPDANKVYKVAMICDSSISDGGWGAACYNAMVTAAEARGWEHAYTDSIDVADYVSAMESYCSLGYDMIFLPGNQYSDATVEVAANYPDIKFAVLNGTDKIISDNIAAILPDADQIGYLAGGLAGLMSKSGVIGFIGGMELDTTKKKLAGFEKAAQHFNPDIVVKSAYAGSFNDTAKGMDTWPQTYSYRNILRGLLPNPTRVGFPPLSGIAGTSFEHQIPSGSASSNHHIPCLNTYHHFHQPRS